MTKARWRPGTPSGSTPNGASATASQYPRRRSGSSMPSPANSACPRSEPGLVPSRQGVDPLRGELEFVGCGADLAPGLVVHRDTVTAALHARLTLRLAGGAHAVEAGRRARGAQPREEAFCLLRKSFLGAEARRIEHDREHAVEDAALGLVVVVSHAAACQRAAEELARHCQAVPLVLAGGEHGAEGLQHSPTRVL